MLGVVDAGLARWRPFLTSGGAATALVALALIGAGTTLALFSSASGETDRFTAGTITLTATASAVCSVGTATGQTAGALFPGNSSTGWSTPAGTDPPCTFQVTYTGNTAYVGLDVLIAAKAGTLPSWAPAGTVAAPLYDGTANGTQLQVTDSRNGAAVYYVNGTEYTAQGASPPPSTQIPAVTCPTGYAGSTCYQVTNLLVSTSVFTSGASDIFTVNYQLPTTSTSGYQNGVAVVVLTAHAVQSKNNPLPTGANACSAAARCSTGFNWS